MIGQPSSLPGSLPMAMMLLWPPCTSSGRDASVLPQSLHRGVEGVAFADAAEVDFHAGPIIGNGPPGRIEHHILESRLGPRFGQLRRSRHSASPSVKAPCLDEGTDGHVEGTGRFLMDAPGQQQQVE